MNIQINGVSYKFTDNQQFIDNYTYCVIAVRDGLEYCISYDAGDIDEDNVDSIDWWHPAMIENIYVKAV